VLGATRWGTLWIARELVVLALLAAVLVLRRRRRPVAVAAIAALAPLLAGLQASTSHAAALESQGNLAIAADTLHLLAAGVWVGGLLALAVVFWPLRGRADASAALRRFGRLAAVSVALLLITGLYSAGRQIETVDGLLTTRYGAALLGKVGLALAVAAVGVLTATLVQSAAGSLSLRLVGRPLVSAGRLRTLIVVEVSLGVLVLLAAGIVTTFAPARGPEFAAAPKLPTSASRTVDDLLVNLSVKPNRPGGNVFTVFAASTRRPPPAPIERVALRLHEVAGGRTVSVELPARGRGRFELGGDQVTAAGRWELGVVIERTGLAPIVTNVAWTVAPAREPRVVVVSDRPLGPLLTSAAAALALMLLGIASWHRLVRRPAGEFPTGAREQAS
jgi:copper transport protein